MIKKEAIIHNLKETGHRLTGLRYALIELFVEMHVPLSVNDIAPYLLNQRLRPNKTTIYRELEFLIKENIIQAIDFGEGKKRYELFNPSNHHHHLICQTCDRVEEIHLNEDLLMQEQEILQRKKFKVTKHMLEFFGLCQMCQKKGL